MAYASEAGMPLIADPGYALGRAAAEAGCLVTSAPGPSAPLVALALSGLPTDSFFFGGFLPNAKSARRRRLEDCAAIPGTLIFFESPKRVAACLDDMEDVLGGTREAVLARELTKKFETVLRAPLSELRRIVAETPPKGEIVLLVGQGHSSELNPEEIDSALKTAMQSVSLRDAVDLVSSAHGLKRKDIYKRALDLSRHDD